MNEPRAKCNSEVAMGTTVVLNGITMSRDLFPYYWTDDFLQELSQAKGWLRYWPPDDLEGETAATAILGTWGDRQQWLITALETIFEASEREGKEDWGIRGIIFALRALHDDFSDLLKFVDMTDRMWNPPLEPPVPGKLELVNGGAHQSAEREVSHD